MTKLACAFLLIAFPVIAQTDNPNKIKDDSVRDIEGCVVRDGGDFYLRPLSGSNGLIHIFAATNQDLASLVGQRVRVQGSDQPAKPAQQAAAGSQPVTPVEKQPTPSTAPSGTPDPNVPVTQLPQSAQAGTGTEGFRGNAPTRELHISSVEPLGGSCNPNAEKPGPKKP